MIFAQHLSCRNLPTCRLYAKSTIIYVGAGVLSDVALEQIFNSTTRVSTAVYGDSYKFIWVSYTAHPSQSAGAFLSQNLDECHDPRVRQECPAATGLQGANETQQIRGAIQQTPRK